MMVQTARRPFAAYFILYLACITPGYYLFTEGGKYTRLPNLAFSVTYLLFLAAVSSLFRSNCYMYLQLILMGMYFNIIIAALSCQKQLQGKKLLMVAAVQHIIKQLQL